jgi:hypothetical protein
VIGNGAGVEPRCARLPSSPAGAHPRAWIEVRRQHLRRRPGG